MAKELYAKPSDVARCVSNFHLITTPCGLDAKEAMLADNPDGKRSNQPNKSAYDYDGSASSKAASE